MVRIPGRERKTFDDDMVDVGSCEFVRDLGIRTVDFLKPQRGVCLRGYRSRFFCRPIAANHFALWSIRYEVIILAVGQSGKDPLPLGIQRCLSQRDPVRILEPESAKKKIWYSASGHPVP